MYVDLLSFCAGHVKLEAESGASSICGLLSPFTLLKVLHDIQLHWVNCIKL